MKIHIHIHLVLLMSIYSFAEVPQVTIALVIDQLAYRNLEKVRPYLKGGLRFLLDEGIVYTQAHVPYAWPSTGAGDATLNTGTLPKEHGIIHNTWGYTSDGNYITCDDGAPETSAVFGPNGLQPYGKSPQYIMVDGLSDQLVMQKQQHKNYHVCAISLKSRSAICTANKLGKAIWFDPQTGMMTSSKAYFSSMPAWLHSFNQKKQASHKPYTWNLCHGCLPAAYQYKHAHNYKGATFSQTLIGKTIQPKASSPDPYKDFMASPAANQLVFDTALACLDAYFCKDNPDEKLFLWVLPSALDMLGHMCGPDTIEVIDMIYHLDRQLKKFMDCVNAKTCKRNILWALTSDHGVAPLPEQMQELGYSGAHRIMCAQIQERVNAHLKDNFDFDNAILSCDNNTMYLNHDLKNSDQKKRTALELGIKNYLETQPGIKKVWSVDQLKTCCLQPGTPELYYQNQLFKGRSGDLIIQTYPYTIISPHNTGSGHHSPYDYDTHIPLIIYQRAHYQRKIVHDTVYNTQFAPTLAHILGIPKPSACTTQVLPEIIFQEDCCF